MNLELLNKARVMRGKRPLGWSSAVLGAVKYLTNAELPGINIEAVFKPWRDRRWERRKKRMEQWK